MSGCSAPSTRSSDGQGALVERLGLLVLPLVGVEVGQVIETASGVGVLGSQHAFADGQGALVERLGLLVLPLVVVEVGQVIETRSGVGVLGSQHAFVDGQGALVERLGLLVLPLVRSRGVARYMRLFASLRVLGPSTCSIIVCAC